MSRSLVLVVVAAMACLACGGGSSPAAPAGDADTAADAPEDDQGVSIDDPDDERALSAAAPTPDLEVLVGEAALCEEIVPEPSSESEPTGTPEEFQQAMSRLLSLGSAHVISVSSADSMTGRIEIGLNTRDPEAIQGLLEIIESRLVCFVLPPVGYDDSTPVPAIWWLDGEPNPTATSISLLVDSSSKQCGENPVGRILAPTVVESDTAVDIRFELTPLPYGDHSCEGWVAVPYVVELQRPFDNRNLTGDGMMDPPQPSPPDANELQASCALLTQPLSEQVQQQQLVTIRVDVDPALGQQELDPVTEQLFDRASDHLWLIDNAEASQVAHVFGETVPPSETQPTTFVLTTPPYRQDQAIEAAASLPEVVRVTPIDVIVPKIDQSLYQVLIDRDSSDDTTRLETAYWVRTGLDPSPHLTSVYGDLTRVAAQLVSELLPGTRNPFSDQLSQDAKADLMAFAQTCNE